uniref:(northern house mosquito) hypothetical protein n=1 Tax=Culex pipiens TaxID=7175 RepID=A0A8D8JKH4_CULPI
MLRIIESASLLSRGDAVVGVVESFSSPVPRLRCSSCCCFSVLMREWRFLILSSDWRSLTLLSVARRTSDVSELSISSKSNPLCSLSMMDFSNSSKCCNEMRFSLLSSRCEPPLSVFALGVIGSLRNSTSKSSVSRWLTLAAMSCSRLRLRRTA